MLPSRSSTLRTRAQSSTAVTVRPLHPPSTSLFADSELVQSTTRTKSSRWSRASRSTFSRTSSGSKCAYRSRLTFSAGSPADSCASQLDGRVATNQGAQGRAWHPLSCSLALLVLVFVRRCTCILCLFLFSFSRPALHSSLNSHCTGSRVAATPRPPLSLPPFTAYTRSPAEPA